jgi:hypothetical protein
MFYQCKVNDKNEVEELHKVVVHKFIVTDSEDPVLHAAQPLWEWEQSEAGQYVIKNAYQTPEWKHQVCVSTFGYEFAIIAILEKKKLSEFYLKFKK